MAQNDICKAKKYSYTQIQDGRHFDEKTRENMKK